MEEKTTELLSDLPVDYDAGNTLKETVPWTKFISITSLISMGLLLIVLVFASQRLSDSFKGNNPDLSNLAAIFIIIGIFVLIVVLAFSAWMLFRFSILVKRGLETQDQESFNKGIHSMMIYSIFIGIFAVLSLISNIYNLIF